MVDLFCIFILVISMEFVKKLRRVILMIFVEIEFMMVVGEFSKINW